MGEEGLLNYTETTTKRESEEGKGREEEERDEHINVPRTGPEHSASVVAGGLADRVAEGGVCVCK
jgi:hypothetical protein